MGRAQLLLGALAAVICVSIALNMVSYLSDHLPSAPVRANAGTDGEGNARVRFLPRERDYKQAHEDGSSVHMKPAPPPPPAATQKTSQAAEDDVATANVEEVAPSPSPPPPPPPPPAPAPLTQVAATVRRHDVKSKSTAKHGEFKAKFSKFTSMFCDGKRPGILWSGFGVKHVEHMAAVVANRTNLHAVESPRVFESGVGCGVWLDGFIKAVPAVSKVGGVDLTKEAVSAARKYFPNDKERLKTGDVTYLDKLGYPTEFYDLGFTYGTFRYLTPDEFCRATQELLRITKVDRYVWVGNHQENPPCPPKKHHTFPKDHVRFCLKGMIDAGMVSVEYFDEKKFFQRGKMGCTAGCCQSVLIHKKMAWAQIVQG